MKAKVKLKTITITLQVDPELLKELRWIAGRDRVTFKSLVEEGLYKVRDASYIPDDVTDELYAKRSGLDPRKRDVQ